MLHILTCLLLTALRRPGPEHRGTGVYLPRTGCRAVLLGQLRRAAPGPLPRRHRHQDRRRGGQAARGRGPGYVSRGNHFGRRLRPGPLPDARQRLDGRIRAPLTFSRRHRAARPRRALPQPHEQRRYLVRCRDVARGGGRHDRLSGNSGSSFGPHLSISSCATPRHSVRNVVREGSSAPRTTSCPASCGCTTSRSTRWRCRPTAGATAWSAKPRAATG